MKSDKQKAIMHIKKYLGVFKRGEPFFGIVLAEYVREKIGKREMYPDTVFRYMRELRCSGDINYKVENKRESKYVKL